MNAGILNIAAKMGCHRLPERCFKIRGKPMPFCARCFGASIGHVMSFALFCAGMLPPFSICLIFMAIIFCDWFLQKRFNIMSTNPRRFVTGIVGGLGVGSVIWIGVNYVVSQLI